MKQIKFRAWIDSEAMLYNIMPVDNYVAIDLSSPSFPQIWDEFEYMQFTGLKDKTGKDIYENDIAKLKFHTAHYVCEWQDKYARFVWRCLVADECRTLAEESEIIGNIYENHELV
jgi:uncharacterized phage protein (TIGR01671 family)